jgi:hypothetical protein
VRRAKDPQLQPVALPRNSIHVTFKLFYIKFNNIFKNQ